MGLTRPLVGERGFSTEKVSKKCTLFVDHVPSTATRTKWPALSARFAQSIITQEVGDQQQGRTAMVSHNSMSLELYYCPLIDILKLILPVIVFLYHNGNGEAGRGGYT